MTATHEWGSEHIERLLHDPEVRALCGARLVIVGTAEFLGARPLTELPGQLGAWAEAERVPFTSAALEAARCGLSEVLPRIEGIPFVYLAASHVRLAVYDVVAGELGPWLWSYVEN